MIQWFRNSKGRLVKIIIPQEPQESQETDSKVSLNFDPMEPHMKSSRVSKELTETSMHSDP